MDNDLGTSWDKQKPMDGSENYETDGNCLFKMLVQIHGQVGDHLPLGTNFVDDTCLSSLLWLGRVITAIIPWIHIATSTFSLTKPL